MSAQLFDVGSSISFNCAFCCASVPKSACAMASSTSSVFAAFRPFLRRSRALPIFLENPCSYWKILERGCLETGTQCLVREPELGPGLAWTSRSFSFQARAPQAFVGSEVVLKSKISLEPLSARLRLQISNLALQVRNFGLPQLNGPSRTAVKPHPVDCQTDLQRQRL